MAERIRWYDFLVQSVIERCRVWLTRLLSWRPRSGAEKARVASEAAERVARATVQARLRADVALGPSLISAHPKLQALTPRAVDALGTDIISREPLFDVPPSDGRSLSDWVAFVRNRFPSGLPRLAARWSDLRGTHAGQVRVRDGTWYIDIDRRFSENSALTVAVIAHELAHVLLLSRRLSLPVTAEDEELTDTTAVLAGFGPVMLKSLLVESYLTNSESVEVSGLRVGYLSMSELVYLTALQWEYAGNEAALLESRLEPWHHYAFFEYLDLREAPMREQETARAKCFACGSVDLAMHERIPGARRCRRCSLTLRAPKPWREYVIAHR